MDKKSAIIEKGLSKGISAKGIDMALKDLGYSGYIPILHAPNWQRLPGRFSENLVQFKKDLSTVGGALVEPFANVVNAGVEEPTITGRLSKVKDAFINAVNDKDIRNIISHGIAGAGAGSLSPRIGGAVGGGLTGAMIGLSGGGREGAKNVANAILSTYNTNTEDIMNRNIKLSNITQGIFDNPLYAGLDVAPVVAKPISQSITSSIPKDAPLAIQQILPSKELRAFNRSAQQTINKAQTYTNRYYDGIKVLQGIPDINREELVRYIVENKTNLKGEQLKLADNIKNNLVNIEKELIKNGTLDAKMSKDNIISQYVMSQLKDNRLLHDDVFDIVSTGIPKRRDIEGLLYSDKALSSKLYKLVREGEDLYDKKKIAWFTQALAPTRDPFGKVIASDVAKTGSGYFGTKRVIGQQTIENLGKVADDSIKHQLDQASLSIESSRILDDLLNNGDISKLITKEMTKLPEGKVGISKDKFINAIREDVMAGKPIDVSKAYNKALSNEVGSYLVDSIYGEVINNIFKQPSNSWLSRLNARFKKAVLGQPHWVLLNRIGNLSNNLMEGVGYREYNLARGRYKKYLPERLKQQTSFNSYIMGEGDNYKVNNYQLSFSKPFVDMNKGLNKFDDSQKSLSDYGRLVETMYGGVSDIVSNPFFMLESGLELTDRYANFIKQAERYAEANKLKLPRVLKEAQTNDKLFNTLNNEVNKSLGDYVGRNYAIPRNVYDKLSLGVPFYRFLTQTGRTTGNQLINRPGAFYSYVSLPTHVGHDIYETILDRYNLDREFYQGGVPYQKEDGKIRMISTEPLPIGTLLGEAGNILTGRDFRSNLSPFLTSIPDALAFQRFGRTASTPRLTELKAEGREREFRPTLNERIRYLLNTILQSSNATYNLGTRYVPDLMSTIFNRPIQSRYDTALGIGSGSYNPASTVRTLPTEQIGKWFSIQSRELQRNARKSRATIQRDIFKSSMVKKKIKENQKKMNRKDK